MILQAEPLKENPINREDYLGVHVGAGFCPLTGHLRRFGVQSGIITTN